MDISVKCPNCYQQVSKNNRFCIFCGYDLSGTAAASTEEASPPTEPDTAAPDPVVYDGPRFCPKGHDVPDPSLGFCPVCGSPLAEEPASTETAHEEEETISAEESVISSKEPVVFSSRKCKCGYVCDDPELHFCPACGMPLDSASGTVDLGWVCSCGEKNPSDMLFCSGCGKPKGYVPADDELPRESVEAPVPAGMRPPTDSDLKKKSTYDP